MKPKLFRPMLFPLATLFFLTSSFVGFCGAPPLLNFQGRIVISGVSYNGAGQFQFALVDGAGTTTFWSNDGSSAGGGEPSASITLTMTNGLYAVLLGDTNLSGMSQSLNASIFTNSDVRLRVWFNDGTHGFEQLSPDQRIASAGYALVADTANNFSGAVSASQLPANLATTNFVLSQNYITATITNGLATVSYVNSVTNGLVTANITNGLATVSYVNIATNGLVTASITNGLATTNFVLSQNYATTSVTNGLATIAYVNTATNGFVGATITNGLATISYVNTATNGFVTANITNSLATTNFVLSQNYATTSVTNGLATIVYVNSATNGFVKASITNGLATTNFVLSQNYATTSVTNGLATIAYVNTATNGFVGATITNGLATVSYVNSVTNGFVTANITNGLATTNFVLSQNYATTSVTNGLATIAYVNTATNGLVTSTVTNGLATIAYVNFGTNFVGTNALAQLNSASNVLAGRIIAATNTITVFAPTNTASLSFPFLAISANAALHTNLNQRAQLVGMAVLSATGGTEAAITLIIKQGSVTNIFPMLLGRGGSTPVTNAIPFNFPLNPNAVWSFTNLSDAGSSAYITNAFIVGE